MGKKTQQLLLFLLVLATRIPFLFYGYGVEEDSWGHVLNAALMNETGIYEISRLPGHPLYEALLVILWNVHSPFLYNSISAVASAGAVVVFFRIVEMHQVKLAFWWSLAFGVVPVFFISSTYTIDYSIALFFVLLATEATMNQKEERAGIWLAVAVATRITSLGMLLPMAYLLLRDKRKEKSVALRIRRATKLTFITAFLSLVFFLPVISRYGIAFFDFHKPPYPDIIEAFYKMSIGVWGLVGCLAIGFLLVLLARKKVFKWADKNAMLFGLTFVVYAVAYFRMPEKAAFWLPVVPFFLLLAAQHISTKMARFAIALLLISPFVFGINKTDKYTGSAHSALAATFGSSNGELFIDPIQGPIINDLTKRQTKMAAAEKIQYQLMIQRQATLVIAGWWYAHLEVDRRDGKWSNANIALVYFASPEELKSWQEKGYQLRYLPEQQAINDKKYRTTFTAENATLFPIE